MQTTFKHELRFEDQPQIGFSRFLRTTMAESFSEDGVESCCGFAIRFFPDEFRPRRRDARFGKPGRILNLSAPNYSTGRQEGARFLDLDGQDV